MIKTSLKNDKFEITDSSKNGNKWTYTILKNRSFNKDGLKEHIVADKNFDKENDEIY